VTGSKALRLFRRLPAGLIGVAAVLVGLAPIRPQSVTGATPGGQGVPVLMYHRVDPYLSARDPITVHLTVMQPAFEAQLRLLEAAGYQPMSLEMLRRSLDQQALPKRRVVLTFDDGYEDNYTIVYPLLRKHGFTATFFIVTSSVGTRDHLTAAQIRELAQAGMEMESHGVHHVDFAQLPQSTARAELVQSRATIEAWSGQRVAFFAYPAGRYSTPLERLLESLGYQGALTERPGFVTASSQPYLLERVRVDHDDTAASFARKLGLPAP
jgi:peptidoglycan/xylan/chitin deacetylase (PgdA/CDA1 family)